VALFLQSWNENVRRKKPHQRLEALRQWLMKEGILQSFLLVIVFLCIVFSHSRAGFTLTLLGLGGYFFFYQIYLKAWRRAAVIGVLAILAVVIALAIAMQFSDRFAVLFSDYSSLDRLKVYGLGLHALQDNPWLGYGLNGFEPEFRLYQQDMIMEFNHAHSDVLESLLDLGIPVGLTLWAAVALLLSGLWHGIRHRRQNGLFPALGLAASMMILGHACIDFSLQIPGDVILWAALLGAGLAQSWPQAERQKAV
jgi:O-antigen ligase